MCFCVYKGFSHCIYFVGLKVIQQKKNINMKIFLIQRRNLNKTKQQTLQTKKKIKDKQAKERNKE